MQLKKLDRIQKGELISAKDRLNYYNNLANLLQAELYDEIRVQENLDYYESRRDNAIEKLKIAIETIDALKNIMPSDLPRDAFSTHVA